MVRNSLVSQIGLFIVPFILLSSSGNTQREVILPCQFFLDKTNPAGHASIPLLCWLKVKGEGFIFSQPLLPSPNSKMCSLTEWTQRVLVLKKG